jgi:hypothetical protein
MARKFNPFKMFSPSIEEKASFPKFYKNGKEITKEITKKVIAEEVSVMKETKKIINEKSSSANPS